MGPEQLEGPNPPYVDIDPSEARSRLKRAPSRAPPYNYRLNDDVDDVVALVPLLETRVIRDAQALRS